MQRIGHLDRAYWNTSSSTVPFWWFCYSLNVTVTTITNRFLACHSWVVRESREKVARQKKDSKGVLTLYTDRPMPSLCPVPRCGNRVKSSLGILKIPESPASVAHNERGRTTRKRIKDGIHNRARLSSSLVCVCVQVWLCSPGPND